eukprot:3094194-Prymnesium_polylepis.1
MNSRESKSRAPQIGCAPTRTSSRIGITQPPLPSMRAFSSSTSTLWSFDNRTGVGSGLPSTWCARPRVQTREKMARYCAGRQ